MARVTKAVIPVAGMGTRFLPATKAQPKEMLPLIDKPTIQYIVEEAVRAGLHDILMVTRQGKDSLEDHFGRSIELEQFLEKTGKKEELAELRAISDMAKFHFVRQLEPRGLGHAVSVARDHVGNEPFAVLLGDDVMDERSTLLADMVRVSESTGCSVIALSPVPIDQISSYGCAGVETTGEGLRRLTKFVEKPTPEEAPSDLASTGHYILTPDIFDCLDRVTPGADGEIQLTDAIALLMEEQPVYGYIFEKGRHDVGKPLDYLKATVELALLREDLGPEFRKFLIELAEREGWNT